jgi:hypothetical protein
LVRALNDPYIGVRYGAADALGILGPRAKAAIPALEAIKAQPGRKQDGSGWQREEMKLIDKALNRIRADGKK